MFRASPLVIAVLLVAAAAPAHAQATVRGTVRDDTGTPLAGARVSGGGRAAAADHAGAWVLRGLPAGEHRLEATLLGHAPAAVVIHLDDGSAPTIEIVLVRTPLELPALRVAASPSDGEPAALAQGSARLTGRALEREVGGTVAATLAAQPGVAVRSMGPAASMPVVRGLTGDRVLVLHDGQRAGDLAGSADDHGITLDPLAARRVEVVRGPAALLYGNNALGGVVNVVTGDVPDHRPARAAWTFAGHSESAHPGAAASARVAVPLGGASAATARGGIRRSADVRLPGGARLANTGAASWSAAVGIGRLDEGGGAVGAAVRGYGFAYGLPVPPGTDPVRLEGGRREAQARVERGVLRVDAGVQRYAHDELDAASGALLQRFALGTATAAALLRGKGSALGASLLAKDYRATGPSALTPPARSLGAGAFGYREAAAGPVTLQLGVRVDGYRVRSEAAETFGPGRSRAFAALSGAAGGRLPLGAGVEASASLARAFRAPSVEELFSSAAHAGTGAVELGEPGLRAERATAAEAGVRVERARLAAELAVHHTRIGGYVHLRSRGDTVLGGATLPVLAYAQAPARIAGVEGSLEAAVAPSLVLTLTGDALRGTLGDGTPLSYLPPARLAAGARWEGGRASLAVDVRHAFRQHRVGAADEAPTAAYTLARASAAIRFPCAGGAHSLTLRVDNLADASYRDATSRIKDFAPGPGRSVSLLYRLIR